MYLVLASSQLYICHQPLGTSIRLSSDGLAWVNLSLDALTIGSTVNATCCTSVPREETHRVDIYIKIDEAATCRLTEKRIAIRDKIGENVTGQKET